MPRPPLLLICALLVPALCACTPRQAASLAEPKLTGTNLPPSTVNCVPDYTRPDFAALERDLAAARARWSAAKVGNYSYDFAQIAAPVLFPTVRVTVRDGAVSGVTLAPGQTGEIGGQARATVEERFAAIAETLQGQREQKCPDVQVDYDPADGHPLRLHSGSREENIADGWGEWRVTNFSRP